MSLRPMGFLKEAAAFVAGTSVTTAVSVTSSMTDLALDLGYREVQRMPQGDGRHVLREAILAADAANAMAKAASSVGFSIVHKMTGNTAANLGGSFDRAAKFLAQAARERNAKLGDRIDHDR